MVRCSALTPPVNLSCGIWQTSPGSARFFGSMHCLSPCEYRDHRARCPRRHSGSAELGVTIALPTLATANRPGCSNIDERHDAALEQRHPTICNVIYAASYLQLPGSHTGRQDWLICLEFRHTASDMSPDHGLERRRMIAARPHALDGWPDFVDKSREVTGRRRSAFDRFDRRLHGPAAAMAKHQDQTCRKRGRRIFQAGDAKRLDAVAGVADNEQFAWMAVEDQFGCNARLPMQDLHCHNPRCSQERRASDAQRAEDL